MSPRSEAGFEGKDGERYDPRGAFEEGTPLQYTFMVPADAEGLAALLGGRDALGDRLDAYFLKSTTIDATGQPDLATGHVGGHCHGNEPGHHAPYLYNVAGRPWRVAETVDAIRALYSSAADGLPGNDDAGQMSAWYVWSALGLYPVDPCGSTVHLGKPSVTRADARVPGGRALTVVADASCAAAGTYVSRVTFDGAPVRAYEIAHATIRRGGRLAFTCGSERVDYARAEAAAGEDAPRLRAGAGAPPPDWAAALLEAAAILAVGVAVGVRRRWGAGGKPPKEN